MRQLQTLVAVADTGSFAAAARIVNLTASAVSQQIQALEGELGVVLFDRRTRPPRLNAKGEEVVRAARGVVRILTETRAAISGGRTAGVLKIGAIRTVSMQLVPLAFAAIRPAYPDLTFDLKVGMSEGLMADVAAGRLDAAVVAEHVGVPTGLIWRPVLTEPLVLAAPAGAEGRDAAALLSDLPFIRYETGVPLARQIETELSRMGVRPAGIAVTNTMPAIVGCVAAGLGVAVVPRIALLDVPLGLVRAVPFGDGAITRRLGLAERQVSARAEVLKALARALGDAVAPSPAELDPPV
ncbi:LysR family transcriptional regulator [Roseivivax isoporae]|nr:LysR family transcriptional regulator [Roseivivax isoporae]